MSSRHGVIPVNLSPFLCVKTAKKWKCFEKVTVRMGLYVFLGAVRMGLWYCTDGSSWTSVHVGNQSAHTHVATSVLIHSLFHNCACLRDLSRLNFTCPIRQFLSGFTSTMLVTTAFRHISIIIRTAFNLPMVWFTRLLHNDRFASHSSLVTSDTFMSEASKINFKDKVHWCRCHWLENYRPCRNWKKKCSIQL